MAALSIANSFHKTNVSIQVVRTRNCHRVQTVMACQRGEPTIDTSGPKAKKELRPENQPPSRQLFSTVEEFGKELKDKLSPKRKGDLMDVGLAALAFAIYVYMSQQIVCAYCVWIATFKQPW
ncbi:hypothetical protein K2173_012394 [Erythroxylum novogranatense]|uniref:Uncharacterized protein n=1 Tax=Erythroxylum novogranatense TaxID=1862640 RepID=A0AAV8UCF9_9ROSI|nr:hypothetical protein K2173_012394 [Erythroxylum novogranatense]